MASQIVFHPEGARELIQSAQVRNLLESIGGDVKAQAEATASSAEEGSGGRIDGYAAAGFALDYQVRGKRPRVVIKSNAPSATITAAHFHTQKRDGVGHLRAALYKFTRRG